MAVQKKSGLGRGLGELFQRTDLSDEPVSRGTVVEGEEALVKSSDEASVDHDTTTGIDVARETSPSSPASQEIPKDAHFLEIDVDSIVANAQQPRQVFDDEELDELAASIEEIGVLQPIIVRPRDDESYELVMGERRWRASQRAGRKTIPAIIRPTEQHEMLRHALLENLHRVQLNPLEEAAAYQQMLEDFNCTQEELSQRIKRSRPQIANTIRLLRLPATVQRRVAAGVLSAGHARALLGLSDSLAQEQLAQRIVAEGISVRATEELVALWGSNPTSHGTGPRQPRERSEKAIELSAVLSDHFDTRARVDIGKKKGKIVIEFASQEDLDRILGIISPDKEI